MSDTYDLDDGVLTRLQDEIGITAAQAAVASFRVEMARRVPLLQDAVRAEDPSALRRLLHQIKGSALTFGAREMARLAIAGETAISRGEMPAALDLARQTALAIEHTFAARSVS